MVSKRDLNSAELVTMRTSRRPTTVMTANGEVQTREEATENVKELDLFVTVMLLEETAAPQFFLSGSSARIMGIPTTGPVVKNHISPKMAIELNCNMSNNVPFVVLVYRPVPLQRPHLLHHLHHRILYLTLADTPKIQYPKEVRSTSVERRRNPMHKQQKPKTKIKNEGREEVQSDILHELPDWLQEF